MEQGRRTLRQPRRRDHEGSLGFKIARVGSAEDAGKQLALSKWRNHEPPLALAAPASAHADRSMSAEDGICDVVRIDPSLGQVIKAVVGEDQRPVLLAPGIPIWYAFRDARQEPPMMAVEKILRHSDIAITEGIYAHLDNEDVKKGLARMPLAGVEELALATPGYL